MSLGLVASLIVAALLGLLTIGSAGWSSARLPRQRPFLSALAVGLGLGLSSSLFFVWLLLGAPQATFPVAELGLLVLLASAALYAGRVPRAQHPDSRGSAAPGWHRWLALALWLSLACTTAAFLLESATSRQGGWDAWMTWNMHARALFRGGEHWREVLTGLPAWSHPDYPLLVPGSVARIWTYMGRETPLAPAAVAMLFTFGSAGLLYSSVSAVRSRTQGALAALLLLGTKFFILHGTSQYADIPLSFFLLATLALLSLTEVWTEDRRRLLVLAGVTAGLSAWTKNEGLLFILAVPLAYGLVIARARGWRHALDDVRGFAIGLAPVLVMLVSFKIWLAPANDLMSDQGLRQTAERLLEGTRYLQIFSGFKHAVLEVGAKGLTGLLLLAYLLCVGLAPAGPARVGAKTAAIVLCLMLAGYTVVLLTAPAPLLGTNVRSINRLLLQLWPSMLFAYFLSVRTAEEAGVVAPRLSHA